MRTLLALASLTLLVGAGLGCGDDTTTTTVTDMAMSSPDLTVPHDMAQLNCGQIISCTLTAGSATGAQTCLSEGKTASAQKATAFFECALAACTTDAGQDPVCLETTVQSGLQNMGVCASQGSACASDM